MTVIEPLLVALLALASAPIPQESPAKAVPTEPDSPLGYSTCVEQLASGHLLVALSSGSICVLNETTGASVAEYEALDGAIPSLWLTPDQQHIAMGVRGQQLEIRPFDGAGLVAGTETPTKDAKVIIEIGSNEEDDRRAWTHAAWTPSGQHFVTWQRYWYHGSAKGQVKVWGLDGTLAWEGPLASDVAIHPKLDQLAIVQADQVTIGWPGSGFRKVELPGAYGAIDYSPDGKQLAVGGTSMRIQVEGEDRWFHGHKNRYATITLLDAETGLVLNQAQPSTSMFPQEWLQRLSWSPGGDYIGFSAGKGYVGGVLKVKDMKTIQSQFSGGQMWAILDGFWVDDRHYRPCFILDYVKGDTSLVFDVKDPKARRLTPQPDWLGVTHIEGSQDVIARYRNGLARVTPSTMETHWKR